MPALAPYIPPKQADFDAWAANFSGLITISPPTYGLVAGDAVAIANAFTTWHNAYLLITSPTTKTKAAVSAKNTAHTTALATFRPYAQAISLNAGVSSADKTALGVNPRTSVPAPITAPTTYPIIAIPIALTLNHVVRYRDQLASPSVKSKPYGVIGCQIFAIASATPITNVGELLYMQTSPKSPLMQAWQPADVGKTAYYAGRWITRSGLVGPFGPITSMGIV